VAREKNLRPARSARIGAARERSARRTARNLRDRSDDVTIARQRNINRERNFNRERNIRGRNLDVARQRDRSINRTINRERNVSVVNNWRGERFRGERYSAFRNYRREWHDRDWWHHHHPRIVFVLGGWYYWNSGYWYPAWGYDPGYYYPYDGPIYGYGDLTPDQVIINVQVQLQRDGYYAGRIDGILGPMTRRAIAAFQTDHGLAVTAAVDEPTLVTMGLS
jgi:hypothetical protein